MNTTIIIATRNRARSLETTLQHLCEIDPTPPIVVVDNASTDATADIAFDAARRGGTSIQYLALNRNEGAVPRNEGVKLAITPYIAFSDDDSWWETDALAQAEQILDENENVGLLAGRTLVGPENLPDPVNAALAHSPLGYSPDLPGPSIMGFLACAAVVRRDAFEAVGGFSNVLEFVGEETLLAMDLASAGWQLCYAESVIAHHHPFPHRPDSDARAGRELRNRTLTALMRRPIGVCARSAVDLTSKVLQGHADPRTLWDTVTRVPRALRKRRTMPENVEEDVRRLEQEG